MKIRLISSPYHLGHRDVAIGAGPTAFLDGGAAQQLRDAGHEVATVVIESSAIPSHEIGAVFHLNSLLATEVQHTVPDGTFPIVLGGNCSTCLGSLGGLGLTDAAIVWFDAHGDFHTAETTGSGFFDGMPLNIATGNSWHALAKTIPGFRAVPERNVLLAGVRDLDEGEADALEDSAVHMCDYDAIRAGGVAASLVTHLDAIASRVRDLYLHVDLDVVNPKTARINGWQPEGGLTRSELLESLELIGDRFQARGAALTAYDPAFDTDKRGLGIGVEVLQVFGDIGWGP